MAYESWCGGEVRVWLMGAGVDHQKSTVTPHVHVGMEGGMGGWSCIMEGGMGGW